VSYTANPTAPGTRETQRLWQATPCGTDSFCLIDGGNPDEERGVNPYELVMIRGDQVVARVALAGDDWISTANGYVLLAKEGGVYDAALRPILPDSHRSAQALAIDAESVLLMRQTGEPDGMFDEVRVSELELGSRTITELGTVTFDRSSVALRQRRLLAATPEGFALYAF
jgi:hypothetical protein